MRITGLIARKAPTKRFAPAEITPMTKETEPLDPVDMLAAKTNCPRGMWICPVSPTWMPRRIFLLTIRVPEVPVPQPILAEATHKRQDCIGSAKFIENRILFASGGNRSSTGGMSETTGMLGNHCDSPSTESLNYKQYNSTSSPRTLRSPSNVSIHDPKSVCVFTNKQLPLL